jgi:hypothetical protein
MPPRLTIDDVRSYIESIGCKLVSTEYKTNKTPIEYICSCGNPEVQTNVLQSLKRGIRCPKCRIDRLKETNKERYGYEFVSQRPEKKESAIKGMLKHIAEKKHTLEELQEYYKKEGCELLATEYLNCMAKMKFKCHCGRIGENAFNHFSRGQRCNAKECMYKRREETNYVTYGDTSFTRTDAYKEAKKETCLAKYNVEHPMQNAEVFERQEMKSMCFKDYTLPSGKTVKIQGYENYGLDYLLKSYTEEQIAIGRKNQPEIWWNDAKGKKHRYYCDFYIPHEDMVIEVKSTWTYEKGKECEKLARQREATLADGHAYMMLVFTERGECIVL